MVNYMGGERSQTSRITKGLLIGGLALLISAGSYSGLEYHNMHQELVLVKQELTLAQEEIEMLQKERDNTIDYRVRQGYDALRQKSDEIVPQIKDKIVDDKKEIMLYGGLGLLLGACVTYFAKKRTRM